MTFRSTQSPAQIYVIAVNTNMRIFESVLCNKCKSFIVNRAFSILSENLPFHQAINKEADHSIATASIATDHSVLEKDPEDAQKQWSLLWAT